MKVLEKKERSVVVELHIFELGEIVSGLAVSYNKLLKSKSKKIRPSEKAMALASIKRTFDELKKVKDEMVKQLKN